MKKFTHYCERCVWAGQWTGPSPQWLDRREETFDLYYCETSYGASLLARYGNEDHEYLSGSIFLKSGEIVLSSAPLQKAGAVYLADKLIEKEI